MSTWNCRNNRPSMFIAICDLYVCRGSDAYFCFHKYFKKKIYIKKSAPAHVYVYTGKVWKMCFKMHGEKWQMHRETIKILLYIKESEIVSPQGYKLLFALSFTSQILCVTQQNLKLPEEWLLRIVILSFHF